MATGCIDAEPAGLSPLRAEDALFLHAQTARLCQQVGTVLLLDTDSLLAASLLAADFRTEIAKRVGGVPGLCRRLQPPSSRWRRPRWITEPRCRCERAYQHDNPPPRQHRPGAG
jgi:hypothetical protein